MSETTNNGNGRVQRRNLGDEIERLHDILDGLADALSESVSTAVKDAVGTVVREAVQTAVSEVVNNPELLRAALARHEGTQPEPVPVKANRKSVREGVVETIGWLRQKAAEKMAEAWTAISMAWPFCLLVLAWIGAQVAERWNACVGRCIEVRNHVATLAGRIWQFRRTCGIALAVGVACAVAAYLAGPMISAAVCGISGIALTLSGMILVPLGRMLLSDPLSQG